MEVGRRRKRSVEFRGRNGGGRRATEVGALDRRPTPRPRVSETPGRGVSKRASAAAAASAFPETGGGVARRVNAPR